MMRIHPDLIHLLYGVGAVLVLASIVGYVLQRRYSPDGANQSIENLNDRIRAWWVMVVLLGHRLHRRQGGRGAAVRASARSPRCANS